MLPPVLFCDTWCIIEFPNTFCVIAECRHDTGYGLRSHGSHHHVRRQTSSNEKLRGMLPWVRRIARRRTRIETVSNMLSMFALLVM